MNPSEAASSSSSSASLPFPDDPPSARANITASAITEQPPPPKTPKSKSKHDVATRAQALALYAEGYSLSLICASTGFGRSTIYDLQKRAKERGYDPKVSKVILLEYVQDDPRSGRPSKQTAENEELVRSRMIPDEEGQKKTARTIAKELEGTISHSTVHRIMKKSKAAKKGGKRASATATATAAAALAAVAAENQSRQSRPGIPADVLRMEEGLEAALGDEELRAVLTASHQHPSLP